MIEHFLDSTLVIDDNEAEAQPLLDELGKLDVWVKHFQPEELLKRDTPLKRRKLIFLDLYLNERIDLAGNLSIIRNILEKAIGKNYGSYGIILWTKHDEEINQLKERVIKDKEDYCLPLFILPLAKTKYLKDGFQDLISDIDNLLSTNLASNFFVYWDRLVDIGKDHTIQSIYGFANRSYKTLENDLQFILHRLAVNQTGIPLKYLDGYKLEDDAIKAMADMLHYDIIHKHEQDINIFGGKTTFEYSGDRKSAFANLNSRLLLDFKGLDQNIVIPGNVYEVIDKENIYSIKDVPKDAKTVVVEVTPPCDFAVDKKGELSRVIGGFFVEDKNALNNYNKPVYYNFLKGVQISDYQEPQFFIFDYRYSGSVLESELKDITKYKLLFRFKEMVFADILQKSSSHVARLGIPFIM